MRKRELIIVFMFLSTANLLAQNHKDQLKIISSINFEKLDQISNEYQNIQQTFSSSKYKNKILENSNENIYFAGFNKYGSPVYYNLENESSAYSSNIDVIRTSGSSGLNLDGTDIVFGLWDSGYPRVSHQEFSGNIQVIDEAPLSHHATHIAGILIAAGIDPLAKGMAPGATIKSYSTSGWQTEVAEWAANGGMITTHSYTLSNPESNYPLFGIYNEYSKLWDELSYNAPYLIMCTGASNNGNNNYNPDGSRYDLLASNKLGKNSIVVGACEDVLSYTGPSSIVQAVFTSWGPTDDWRIKPDITAVGTDSYSSREQSDSDYDIGQGCSYAGPIVAGGLGLLQQHYHNLNGVYMKAATAKGLILCTTSEAGSYDGPDFSNGWGLFNAEKAAELISNNGSSSHIAELTLDQGGTFTTTINVDGTDTLTVAICWNDPPADERFGIMNDPTPMLINDLDVRVIGSNTTYKPWKLEPNSTHDNYTDAAVKGDNFRDNIEIIEEKAIPAGEYTLSVTHKGNLQSGSQDFSLLINGLSSGVITSVNEITKPEKTMLVYPVPCEGNYIYVEFENSLENDPIEISLFNSHGQKVLSNKFTNTKIKLDVSGLKSGIYILSAIVKGETNTKKIIIR